MKAVLIRYSEIHLKGNNRSYFENALYNNLETALCGFSHKLEKFSCRYVVTDFDEYYAKEICKTAANVFGVYSVSIADEVPSEISEIEKSAAVMCPKKGSFKISVNRADKRFPMNSMELAAHLGGVILDIEPELKVDLTTPDNIIFVDIRESGRTFVFSKVIRAVNGMPVGTGGKAVALLSGGIDSPVACYMMAKRGMSIRAVHFHSFPFTGVQAKEKVLKLASLLKKYTVRMTVDVVSFTEIQTAIHENCPEEYMITVMRRFMMRIAERIAAMHKAGAVVTGESLGQVASQTLESIASTDSVTHIPVFRPLIGFDKDEIIEIARKIGTFETSILPFEDCCTIFLPKRPIIKPRLETVEKIERALDVEKLVENALCSVETVTL